MIRQDKRSWDKGRLDAVHGRPHQCPDDCDALSYASGYIEGKAQRADRPLRVVSEPKPAKKDAP
jgi:hypothetical protein